MNPLYDERMARIRKAIALEPVDKIPVAPCANAYFARSQGVPMKDYITNYELACTANLKAFAEMGSCDATQNVIFSPWLLPTQWLSKVATPGHELGDDELWQVMETQTLKPDDYQDILKNGFESFYNRFLSLNAWTTTRPNWRGFSPICPKVTADSTRQAFPASAIS